VVVRLAYNSLKGLIHGMIGRVQLAAVTMDNFMLHVRERKKPATCERITHPLQWRR
jgi:hypothetical protein